MTSEPRGDAAPDEGCDKSWKLELAIRLERWHSR
jgi:hypothetical protein